MKTYKNSMHLTFEALSVNESFARVAVAAFATQLDPTLEEIADIKTAVSEAVTNSVIHGYEEKGGKIYIDCSFEDKTLDISIKDEGKGIENIDRAREPMFTTRPECERSGMGFTFMELFMDGLEVLSEKDKGTTVKMRKIIGKAE